MTGIFFIAFFISLVCVPITVIKRDERKWRLNETLKGTRWGAEEGGEEKKRQIRKTI